MFKVFFSRKSKTAESSSEFSRFFRDASSGEKKKVFLDVAKKASAEQRETIRHAKLMKG